MHPRSNTRRTTTQLPVCFRLGRFSAAPTCNRWFKRAFTHCRFCSYFEVLVLHFFSWFYLRRWRHAHREGGGELVIPGISRHLTRCMIPRYMDDARCITFFFGILGFGWNNMALPCFTVPITHPIRTPQNNNTAFSLMSFRLVFYWRHGGGIRTARLLEWAHELSSVMQL
jgi:hypothetical protein